MLNAAAAPQQIALDFDISPDPAADDFPVTIKRSPRRRTIEIIVRNGGVDLMLPQFVSTVEGMAFVKSKTEWIVKTLAKQAVHELELAARVKRYEDGEAFQFLGRDYPLRVYLTKNPSAELKNEYLYVGIRSTQRTDKAVAVKKQVWAWYQSQAKMLLTQKTFALAAQIGRECSGVKLRRTKTKWGHCTGDGQIQYNWQIILAPEPIVDYLVAHEVSHLVHHHHGKRFWRHVEKLSPNYLDHEKWLKLNGHKLEL